MDIRLPKKLKILSYYLPSLYIVGGYVRNSLLGLPVSDLDLAAEYTVDEVSAALENTEFGMAKINRRLGTIKIFSRTDNTFSCEYTTFRVDSYPVGSGMHTPSDVHFTKDMEKDARRRDFSVNAIYYSVDTAEYVDFIGGIPDLYKRVIRTTVSPDRVFAEDGLRILRMVRLASELGFDIEEETLSAAKNAVGLLKDISKERIRDEFLKILVADTRYPSEATHEAHLKGFRFLDDIGALQYIVPELLDGKGHLQRPDFHVYDVFEHSVQAMYYCPPEVRLAGLLHDVGKPESVKRYGKMYRHGETGAEIASRLLGRHGFAMSNNEVREVRRLIETHMYDIDGLTSEKKLRLFIVDNHDIIDKLIALKRADAKASSGSADAECVSADKLEKLYEAMKNDGTPMSYSDLHVDGNDLVDTKIPEDKRSWAMRKIFEHAVINKNCRTREELLEYIKGLNYGSN